MSVHTNPLPDAEAQGDRAHRRARWLKRSLLVVAWLLLSNVGAAVVLSQVERAMKTYRIPSSGMEPTLHCAPPGAGCEGDTDDRVFALRFHPFWTPTRGDIIVFETPPAAQRRCGAGGTFVKRLIGLPGETVSERNGYVSINGRPLPEPYVERGHRDRGSGSWHVPEGAYFVLGDNRASSCDSREFGSVPRRNVAGPVVASYWPPDRIGLL